MRVAIDQSPLLTGHKVRGTGFYTQYLIFALKKYHPENDYVLFDLKNVPSGVDIIHYPYFDPFFVSLPIKKRIKTVVTIHDLTPLVLPDLFPAGIRGKIKFSIQRLLSKRIDAVITDSESSKKDIEKILKIKSSKVFLIPLAAGEEFKKKYLTKHEIAKMVKKYKIPKKFLLYVGDATPNKNLKRLVEAIEPLNIPLFIVGKVFENPTKKHPWNKDLIFVQKKASENKNIHLLGFVPAEELVNIYNLADLFVFPSLYEGFGLPILEAAACGIPIVTTRSGSIPEVIGETAVFVDPLDVDSISEGVKKVVKDKALYERLSKEGIERAKKFSWKKTADQTVQVYEEIFNKT
jgi:glycosyltransferase involved in cell wall biosynthesis